MKLEAIQNKLADLSGWQVAMESRAIRKRYEFKNFTSALAFTNAIGALAEEQGHHPDIMLGWGYVECVLLTHDIAGLHENDFIMAAKIDNLLTQ
jgi:4a-hydroxytetrahydrobiopterin dehydratase